MPSSTSSPGTEPKASWLFAFVGFTALALFIIGLTGQPNLVDNERRVGAYVLDVIQNGHWMIQRDSTGEIASKPPLVTWIAATATLACGGLSRFTVYLPSALATALVALVLLKAGRKHFGWEAGLLAALTYLVSPTGDLLVQTARYDGLLALPVTLAALAAYRGWTTGRGWTWFWLAAAVGALVKGPLALLLGSAGLLAALWEWRSGSPQKIRGSHWLGILLFLAICGGWFALAYREMGHALIDKQIKRELVGHALKGVDGEGVGVRFWEPAWACLTIFLPWSIAGVAAFWRVVWHPSADPDARRFERFLFCWFFVGLAVFSLAAHQRPRLVFPLVPAAALLAGRELAQLASRWRPGTLLRAAGGVTAFALACLVFHRQVLLRRSSSVQRTVAIQALAGEVRRDLGAQFPFTYVNAPFAVQFCLNTLRFQAPASRAAELLQGGTPAFVIVGKDDYARLRQLAGTNTPLHELRRLTAKKPGDFLWLLSNHPRLEWTERLASLSGPVRIETRDARPAGVRGGELLYERSSAQGLLIISNQSTNESRELRVRLTGHGPEQAAVAILQPGQTWRSDEADVK